MWGRRVLAASGEKAEAGTPKIEPETNLADPERWVDEYGDYLFKHALVRLRDPVKAEDMVQETFLVALKAGETFAGKGERKKLAARHSEKQDLRLLSDGGPGNFFHRLGILFR